MIAVDFQTLFRGQPKLICFLNLIVIAHSVNYLIVAVVQTPELWLHCSLMLSDAKRWQLVTTDKDREEWRCRISPFRPYWLVMVRKISVIPFIECKRTQATILHDTVPEDTLRSLLAASFHVLADWNNEC